MATLNKPFAATAPITANTAPAPGFVNTYNASAAPRTPTLPALFGLTIGTLLIIEKDPLDASANAVTVTCTGGDTFSDGTTSITLNAAGMQRRLQVAQIGATRYWKKLDGYGGGVGAVGVASVTNVASWTINADTADLAENLSLAGPVTINNPTGSPKNNQLLWIIVQGTASRTITYGTALVNSNTVTRPTTTTGTEPTEMLFRYRAATSQWRCIAIA